MLLSFAITLPRTKKQLRSFLGLCGYFRQFIPSFADLSSSLTPSLTLTAPDRLLWTQTMANSFLNIIDQLCKSTSLHVPSACDFFILLCDASGVGVGGVLNVYRSDVLYPVSYYSRQLCNRERRFSATELEALALLESVKHFRLWQTL